MYKLFHRSNGHIARLLGILLLIPWLCQAQTYPTKTIDLIVPFPPGGVADLIARPIAQKLSQMLGQSVVVENRGGATGTIGAAIVAHAKPDGYTLLFGTSNEITMSPSLYKSLPYNPTRDFTPITPVADFPNVLVVGPSLHGVKSLHDLIKVAHSRAKSLTFASSGIGSTNHLTAVLFKNAAKISILHVPYRGGGPALVGLMGGQVDALFATLPSAMALIKSGKIKALAVTGKRRSPVLPNIPTVKESGLPLTVITWNGMLAPAGTPAAIVDRLHRALLKIMAEPDIAAKLASVGAEPITETSAAFSNEIRHDFSRWAQVIKTAGISPLD